MPQEVASPLTQIMLALVDNMKKSGNPVGVSKDKLSAWARGIEQGKSSLVLYSGCEYQLVPYFLPLVERLKKGGLVDSKLLNLTLRLKGFGLDVISLFASLSAKDSEYYNELVRKHLLLLRKVRSDITILPEELYPGTLLYEFGFFEEFAEHARKVSKVFKERGVKTIVTISPHSLEMLRSVYPSFVEGFDFEVIHYLELLTRYASNLRLSVREPASVTIHDPCHLARSLNIVEEPRAILSSVKGVELREVPFANKRWTTCCGAPIETFLPMLSEGISQRRVKELKESGAEIALTLCPFCHANLRNASLASGLRIMDYVDFLSRCIES
jgi:Fe-S oxidoreductase